MNWNVLIIFFLSCNLNKGNDFIKNQDTNVSKDTGIDDNTVNPSSEPSDEPQDIDQDGFSLDEGDCDDNNPDINPEAEEIPGDGIDQDCNGLDGFDVDGDGFVSIHEGGDDCDDNDTSISPAAVEICDSIDNNCNSEINEDIICSVFVHSSLILYKINPFTYELEEVTSVPGLYDFDTDNNGNLYGISSTSLYQYNNNTLSWNFIGSLNHTGGILNGFALSNNGYGYATAGSHLYRVNLSTGQTTFVGSMGSEFSSSGDCVTDKDDNLYMTSGTTGLDTLVKINGDTAETYAVGETGFANIWGLTFAWGTLYGFTSTGELLEINSVTGEAVLLHTFEGLSFYGAASSEER